MIEVRLHVPEGFQAVARANSICELDGQLRLAVARAESRDCKEGP